MTGATRFRLRENRAGREPVDADLDRQSRPSREPRLDHVARPGGTCCRRCSTPAPAPTIIVVRCTPARADLAGYHVYRATDRGGPWTRATVDRTSARRVLPRHRSRRRARATTIASRRWTAPATRARARGREHQHQPGAADRLADRARRSRVRARSPSATSPATGGKEIVAGNEHLYAWNCERHRAARRRRRPADLGRLRQRDQHRSPARVGARRNGSTIRPASKCSWRPGTTPTRPSWCAGDGSILPGWPRNPDPGQAAKGYWANCPAIDVDGDGLAELFAPAKNGNLYAWRSNGTPLGVQRRVQDRPRDLRAHARRRSRTWTAIPGREIVYGAPNGTLHIWNPDRHQLRAVSRSPRGRVPGNTAVGDMNKDGDPRCRDDHRGRRGATSTTPRPASSCRVAARGRRRAIPSRRRRRSPISTSTASSRSWWRSTTAVEFPDSRLRLHQGRVPAGRRRSAARLPRVRRSSPTSPATVCPDVLFGNEGGLLYGWDRNGVELAGFPLSVGDFIRSTPFADDVDGDGGIDLVLMGWDKNVYIWDFPVPYVPRRRSGRRCRTMRHAAVPGGSTVRRPTPPEPSGPAAPPAQAYLAQNHPNPFNPMTRVGFGVPVPSAVQLELYDSSGRYVRKLARGTQAAGEHRATLGWPRCARRRRRPAYTSCASGSRARSSPASWCSSSRTRKDACAWPRRRSQPVASGASNTLSAACRASSGRRWGSWVEPRTRPPMRKCVPACRARRSGAARVRSRHRHV